MPKCPTCKKEVLPRAQNPVFPFCSTRCRAVDLGKWLGEEYRVPGPLAGLDEEQEEQPPSAKSAAPSDPEPEH